MKSFGYKLIGVLLCLPLLYSCSDKDKGQNDLSAPVIVNRFYPTSGGVGTEILITGKNFSCNINDIQVKIGETPLKILNSDMNNIMAIVPAKAGSGFLKVSVNNREEVSSLEEFNYLFSANVTTFAGNAETPGYLDGLGSDASFNFKDEGGWERGSICVDEQMNVYVGDVVNRCIRKITPEGEVSTLAGKSGTSGSIDGNGVAARFSSFYGMTMGNDGNIYLSDVYNNSIRKMSLDGNVVTLGKTENQPWSIAIDNRNGDIYYSQKDGPGGIYKFVADGTDIKISSRGTLGIAIDSEGNIYACDVNNNSIMKYSADTYTEEVFAGNGIAGYSDGNFNEASFNNPSGIAIDKNGYIYIAGCGWLKGNNIRMLDMKNKIVRTVAGTDEPGYADGLGNSALFDCPQDLTIDSNGVIYVFDKNNSVIRKIVYE